MKISIFFSLSMIAVLVFIVGNNSLGQDKAEDLWGNKIDLNGAISSKQPTVIVPFSASNCGYCLIDGYYVEKNYIENNDHFGGTSFHMSLFNPQLDNYTFQKHFKWTGAILTSPTTLHKYHDDGFPTLLAFKNGKQVLQYFYDYAKFDELKTLLWDTNVRLIPTSELHIANAFMYENDDFASVIVYPDNETIPDDEIRMAAKWKYSCKHIGALKPEDLRKHLKLTGNFDFAKLSRFFPENSVPITFKDNKIVIGEYSFNYDSTGIYACFPSPFNKEKYVVLEQRNKNSYPFWQFNYLDYMIFTGNKKETAQRLLYGHFDKTVDYKWVFDDLHAYSDAEKSHFCTTVCDIPKKWKPRENPVFPIFYKYNEKKDRDEWILGDENCRFPRITTDKTGIAWITWEQHGNICLASIATDGTVRTWFVENNESDSYSPVITVNGNDVWVIYLNERDGFYCLFAKSFDGIRFSDEILLTEKGPFDAVTPAVASDDKGEITIAWSVWKANYRYLFSRKIKAGVLGPVEEIPEVPSVYTRGYTNAWYPSLCYTGDHDVMGAWNQHYPANFGVYSSRIGDSAVSVTQTAKEMDDRENGGYPSIFTSPGNRLFVAWESFAWEVVLDEIPQKIKIAEYNREENQWSFGKVISVDDQTWLNQTPSGTCDSKGNKLVVWSGRTRSETQPWGLYLVKENDGKWAFPVSLSGESENDRFPVISVAPDDKVWISCHTGIGKDMKVKVMKLR